MYFAPPAGVCSKILSSINTLKFLLSVCVCVHDGCGRGRYEFVGRVQNYRVRSSCHRNFLEIVKAAAGQDTQS